MMTIHFGDKVRIQSGFYCGCEGIAIDYKIDDEELYLVEIRKIDCNNCLRTLTIEVTPQNLDKIYK
jgi:hypothetical protein